MRYQRRRAQRQARIVVWIDREDVAFLDSVPLNRSDLIRGLVGMARRGQVDLPAQPARRGLGRRLAELLGVRTVQRPIFPAPGEPEGPRMGETTRNGQIATHGDLRPAGSLLDYPSFLGAPAEPLPDDLVLDEPEPLDLSPLDASGAENVNETGS
jgi:hypothetical protein